MGKRGNGEGSIYQQGDGRWIAAVQDDTVPSGRRKFTGKTRKEVAARMDAAIAARANGAPIVASAESFEAWAHAWLEERRSKLDFGGWRKHDERLRNHIVPAIGRVALANLKPERLDALYNAKLEEGLAPQSVRHIHATIHACLELAVRRGRVVRNVAELVDAPTVEQREMTTFTEDEYRTFLRAAKADDVVGPFLLVDVTTGMRKSELLGLRWRNVNLDKGEINLTMNLQRDREGRLVLKKVKTKRSRRSVMLAKDAVDALRARRARQAEQRLAAGPGWGVDVVLAGELERVTDFVFTRDDGAPYAPSVLRRKFMAILEASGLPALRIHDLRHSIATLLLGRGVHPKIVSEMLGHARTSITMDLYSHVTPTMQREAVSVIEAVGGSR